MNLVDAIHANMPDGLRANVETYTDVPYRNQGTHVEAIYISKDGRWWPKDDVQPPLRESYPASALIPNLRTCWRTRAVLVSPVSNLRKLALAYFKKRRN